MPRLPPARFVLLEGSAASIACAYAPASPHFSCFDEALQRIRAWFPASGSGDGIALSQHQRFVHQRAEVIERRPRIDALVAYEYRASR
jgi:hypothetical protein